MIDAHMTPVQAIKLALLRTLHTDNTSAGFESILKR